MTWVDILVRGRWSTLAVSVRVGGGLRLRRGKRTVWESHGHGDEFCLQPGGIAVGYIYRCIGMNKALECSPNYPHTRLSTTRSHVRASDFRWGGRRGGGGIFYNVLRLRLSFQVVPDLCFRIILDLVSGLARAPWKCPRPRPSWSRSRSRPGGHQTALE